MNKPVQRGVRTPKSHGAGGGAPIGRVHKLRDNGVPRTAWVRRRSSGVKAESRPTTLTKETAQE